MIVLDDAPEEAAGMMVAILGTEDDDGPVLVLLQLDRARVAMTANEAAEIARTLLAVADLVAAGLRLEDGGTVPLNATREEIVATTERNRDLVLPAPLQPMENN